MLIDLSVLVTKSKNGEALENEKSVAFGHLGTHFDVMNKQFPLEFVNRNGVVFDVRGIRDREISVQDIDIFRVEPDMFVAFCSGFIEEFEYGSKEYFTDHPHLAPELIDLLLARKISIIGVDFAGVRRGIEHTPMDQYCADHGVFVVENLCNLAFVLDQQQVATCLVHTYPVNFSGLTGLPCRVVAEII